MSTPISRKTIYVFHKNGANSHYLGLNELLRQHDIDIKYREFSVFSKIFKGLFKFRGKLLKKQVKNIGFIIKLLWTKDQKVVLGIAPYDKKLIFLLKLLNNHQVYYHTSWPFWDKSFHPKKNSSKKVFEAWRKFLEEKNKHIFAVTYLVKKNLCDNYNINPKFISTVHQTLLSQYKSNFKPVARKEKSFLFVGRLIKSKGVLEIVQYFQKNPNSCLSIVGKGKLENEIKNIAKNHKNIIFYGEIKNKQKLIELYKIHQFLILNTKRTKKGDELFGMVIIEAMAHGMIPIAPKLVGPRQIISKDFGYLFQEGSLELILNQVIKEGYDLKKSKMAFKNAQNYTLENSAKKWKAILA